MKPLLIMFTLIIYSIGDTALAYHSSKQSAHSYCLPEQSCWPTQAQWDALNKQVNGHLLTGVSPLAPCTKEPKSKLCQEKLNELKNPIYIASQPGATQSNGLVDAWQTAVSPYVVAVESAQEIANAVNFARQHNIRLVIKSTGHDYLGRSNAPNSLLIWTHNMRKVTFDSHFIPQGCPISQEPTKTMTAEAGANWLEAYDLVTTTHGRYVQGGGCTTVGVAGGFTQGGGFGSYSKKFGTGAAGVIQAEVITADGKIRIANACQNQDLFWALKGGGGGTYGIVSKITLQTHDLPTLFGSVSGSITAKSDLDYKKLINHFVDFYQGNLNNEHWGEQLSLTPSNKMNIALVFEGLSKNDVDKIWQPFRNWLSKQPEQYQFAINITTRPAINNWNFAYITEKYPDAIVANNMQNGPYNEFWWAGNQSEVSVYLTHYLSMYLPFKLFDKQHANRLTNALFNASRLTDIGLHFNKGLSGGSTDAISRQRNTSMNPAVSDAAALIIIAGGQENTYADVPGHQLNLIKAQQAKKWGNKAMKLLNDLSPNSGSYPNEADYFITNWQQAFWGSNYAKLLQIKHKYDPNNLFTCHHCVGSE